MLSLVLGGFALGFAIAATPGQLFFLCLRRTLIQGWFTGVISGLGVATADGLYGAVAAFGISAVSAALVGQRRWLALIHWRRRPGSARNSEHAAASSARYGAGAGR